MSNPKKMSPTPKAGKLKVVIFVEHDIVYRHFIKSSAFKGLIDTCETTFIFPAVGPENKRLTIEPDPEEVGAQFLRLKIDGSRIKLWRRLFQVSQFVWRPGREWAGLRRFMRKLLGRNASILSTILALPVIYPLFKHWTLRRLDDLPSPLGEELDKRCPDVVVHPTVLDGLFVNDVVMEARARGIPSILIMNSWDNPSTKRAVVGSPDYLLVWGEQTKSHAIHYMQMNGAHVVPFGAAQFDIYRAPARIDREEFCRRHNVHPSRKLILYAGSSKGSDEFSHLQHIDRAISDGEISDCVVIYRPHPWGRGGWKGERIIEEKWQNIVIEQSMRTYLESLKANNAAVYLADYADTHDVLSAVDALVSPLSTIILEAALHGKPAMCFLPDHNVGSSLDLQSQLPHFKEMFEDPLIIKAKGMSELTSGLKLLLDRVGHDSQEIRKACDFYVAEFSEPYSCRLATFVAEVAIAGRRARLGATQGA